MTKHHGRGRPRKNNTRLRELWRNASHKYYHKNRKKILEKARCKGFEMEAST